MTSKLYFVLHTYLLLEYINSISTYVVVYKGQHERHM